VYAAGVVEAKGSPEEFLGTALASDVHPGVVFRLERVLGTGATATAFFATRTSAQGDSPAVVKIILPRVVMQGGDTASMVVRKEAVALGRLNERVPPTPFVVRFLDSGMVALPSRLRGYTLPWLAIEYVHGGVEGTTLDERVRFSLQRTGYAFDRKRALRALSHICDGLAEVHDVGVIHRDLTPNNVLCCGFGDAELFKLSDFGIARPTGMEATFGAQVLGTPGYIAPEQGFQVEGGPTPVSDLFSVAGIAYYVLTGETYFSSRNPVEALMLARAPERRSLAEAAALCTELRKDPEALQGIDQALAQATHVDPASRPQSARALALSLLPWLDRGDSVRPSERHVSSVVRSSPPAEASGPNWVVRHPPGDDMAVLSVGWDADGHCLGATSAGLRFWDGTEWHPVPTPELPVSDRIRFVRRIEPGRWLLGTAGATLAEYSRGGVTRILRGPDPQVVFSAASGHLGDLAVVIGERAGSPPLLCALSGGRWLKPLPVAQMSTVMSLARIDDTHWLIAGRGMDGRGLAALYSPLMWEVEPLVVPESRALVACCGSVERELGVAVGSHGVVVRVERRQVQSEQIETQPSLAATDVDVLDRTWAGAAGALWVSVRRGTDWTRVWSDASWQAPFISIHADVGCVVAMTADGGILECRTLAAAPALASIPSHV